MTNQEAISKFKLTVGYGIPTGSGIKTPQKGLKVNAGKPTAIEIEYIKAHKNEIMAEIEAETAKKVQEAADAKQTRIDAIKSGEVKIEARYEDGEYLQGYIVFEESAELLKELGLAKDISGWGCHVESALIDSLGKEFTYQQAYEFARPAIEAQEIKRAEKEDKRQTVFATAKETNEKQLLRQWSENCNNHREECSMDMVYEWAMPDGTTKITRQHTW